MELENSDASKRDHVSAHATGTDTSGPTGGAEPRVPGPSGEPEPIDLLGAAGTPSAKRLVPALVAAVLGLLIIRYLLRRGRS